MLWIDIPSLVISTALPGAGYGFGVTGYLVYKNNTNIAKQISIAKDIGDALKEKIKLGASGDELTKFLIKLDCNSKQLEDLLANKA